MRLKDAILETAQRLGGLALVRDSGWRQRRLMILCYHGVSMIDEHEWHPELYVTQERLRERLRALRDGGYQILPLAEATRRLYDGTLPPRSVALTFDDGAVDFERRALPVLREFNAPATLYLTTYYCLARFPVFDTVLGYVIWKGRASGADVSMHAESGTPLPVASASERGRARSALHAYAQRQGMSAQEKNAYVSKIATTLGVDYAAIVASGVLQIMTPDAVRALPRDLVDVQLHTHRHRTPRDHALFVREIKDNAEATRDILGNGAKLDHFCYPSGDYDGAFLAWLRECGVQYATTCVPDLASADSDPLLLPRFVDTMRQSNAAFEAWVSGFAALLPRKAENRLSAERLAGATPRANPRIPAPR